MTGLACLLLLQVVTRLGEAAQRTIFVLSLVFDFVFGEIKPNVLEHLVLTVSGLLTAADEDVSERNLVELLLLFSRLAAYQNGFGNVVTCRARLEQACTGFVDPLGNTQIAHAHFSSAMAATSMLRDRLTRTPAEAFDLDFIFMLGIVALAFDSIDFQKIID